MKPRYDAGMKIFRFPLVFALTAVTVPAVFAPTTQAQTASNPEKMDAFLNLMTKARDHAKAHGVKIAPVLSPVDATLLGPHPAVDVAALHGAGFRVIPWTTDTPEKMKALIALRVDGIITDYPDMLQAVLKEEKTAAGNDTAAQAYFANFDVAAHRGGRGLRPENTLPSFEDGLDHLSTTLETDTGVTTDHVSLIWHDQFLNPQSCRRADGAPYTLENKVYTRDISSVDAQKTFICDKLHFGSQQTNDLALSPVAVEFAKQEHLMSPYVPTYVEQLFRFVAFYAHYYKDGAGRNTPGATARWQNAQKVRFNLETKILPELSAEATKAAGEAERNHTVDPQTFVKTLCGAITKYHMEGRAELQSFDFRTLILVEEQYPSIPTYYLTGDPKTLSSELVPVALRQSAAR
jgi:glycerophosphoryl diester phosphodiesterase